MTEGDGHRRPSPRLAGEVAAEAGAASGPSSWTRKRFNEAMLLSAVWACAPKPPAGDDQASPEAAPDATPEDRIVRIIREYDALGWHRTGSEGDQECARWLLREAEAAGAEVELEPLPFGRIDVRECFVEVGGRRLEATPVYDAPFTEAEGRSGVLGAPDGAGTEIGLVHASPYATADDELEPYRRRSRHAAIVAVMGGEEFGLPSHGAAVRNAEAYRAPFGPPAVQVGVDHLELLRGSAERGEMARVVDHCVRVGTEVYNTLAFLPGRSPELPPVVVMTPRSGWWHCASERGGGIAVWVELLRALAARQPLRDVHFVASTGHELGHLGLEHYLAARRSLIGGALAWIHLGANFVGRYGAQPTLQIGDEALERTARAALREHGLSERAQISQQQPPLGEARNIFAGGGRYLSILSPNGLFHHPDDRFPNAVDVDAAIAWSRFFVDVGRSLADTPA